MINKDIAQNKMINCIDAAQLRNIGEARCKRINKLRKT